MAEEINPVPVLAASTILKHAKVSTVFEFEQEYGHLVRSTTEYHGLGYKVLKTALLNRRAVDLTTSEWTDTRVLVSEGVIRQWLDTFGKHNRPAIEIGISPTERPPATPGELEEEYGGPLRRYVALGFVGRGAVQQYLREHGIIVGDHTIRRWMELYSSCLPEWVIPWDPEVALVDLNTHERNLQVWHRVWGLPITTVAHRLRVLLEDDGEYTTVSYFAVRDFFQRNPLRVFTSWQLLLQGRVATYLVELKARHTYTGPKSIDWDDMHQQPLLRKMLWEQYAVRCDFPANELHKVWDYVCKPEEPYAAVMPCSQCGYLFPETKVIVEPSWFRHRDGAFVWTCQSYPASRDFGTVTLQFLNVSITGSTEIQENQRKSKEKHEKIIRKSKKSQENQRKSKKIQENQRKCQENQRKSKKIQENPKKI
jgi:hypothetical protein